MRLLLCLLLAASLLGAAAFVRRVFRLPAAFCPAVALACQILCLYALALPDLLRPGVYAATLFGLAALLWCGLRDRGLWRELLEPGVIFFLLYILFFAAANHRILPVGYDNFSHWAVIAKEMYLTDALPKPGTMVIFTNYPPASALYEYYLFQFLGFGERQMMLAINVLEGAMVSCCFAGARWDRRRNLLFRLVLAFGVLTVIVEHFRNLYVDALLGFILLAMGVMALWDDGFSKRTAVPQALLGALLILTKMSGVMLLLFHAALLFVLKYRRGPDRPSIRLHLLSLAGACGAAYLSFSLHVRFTFGQAVSNNQFLLTFDNFSAKLQGKSPEFWSEFPRALLGAYLSRSNSCSRFFPLFNLCLLILLVAAVRGKRLPKRVRGLIPFSWACAVFYSLSLAAMYVFMMSESESLMAASFPRYFGTLVIYQLGLPFAAILLDSEDDMLAGLSLRRFALCFCALACAAALAGRLTWHPLRWQTNLRHAQIAAVGKILSAADQLEDQIDGEGAFVLSCVDYDRVSPSLMYYVFRYAFLKPNLRPLSENYWQERYYAGETEPCYILWLEPYGWAEAALADAEIMVPQQPGLYYKDENNQLTLVQELIGLNGG